MSDKKYTEGFFSNNAEGWVNDAYENASKYPVANNRVRIALNAITNNSKSLTASSLLDMGCGGGEMCLAAASLGLNVTGIDIAEGMIAECQKKKSTLDTSSQNNIDFFQCDVLKNDLSNNSFDFVSALGLIEYLKNDELFFEKAKSLLKPNGRLVVSCRNKLFNLKSLNNYTINETQNGSTSVLLEELTRKVMEYTDKNIEKDIMHKFINKIQNVAPRLEEKLSSDEPSKPSLEFKKPRKQHTPEEIIKITEPMGYKNFKFYGVHPHVLPPNIKFQFPSFYNLLSEIFDVFEETPLSLIWCSTFIVSMEI